MLVWLAMALLALAPLRPPKSPEGVIPLEEGGRCHFEAGGAGRAPACDCGLLSGRQRRLLGLPVPLAGSVPADLEALPGIGPALAAAIVAERERAGDFATVSDLSRVRGIGPRTAARLAPLVVAADGDLGCE